MNIIFWKDFLNKENFLRRGCFTKQKENAGTPENQQNVVEDVRSIINDVRVQKDSAVKFYTKKFDGVDLKSLCLSEAIWSQKNLVDAQTQQSLKTAYDNIKAFHELQIPQNITLNHNGMCLRRNFYGLERVGLYVPGGTAPLISTLLMLAIPASLAGCKEIIVVTPPDHATGTIHPALIAAAKLCGVTEIFTCGGAQAIAALAYGTETIPKVMKIFGPGNKYVTEAKQQVSQDPQGCARDMPAGPSEVLVIADEHASVPFIAADLLAQAEHDADSQAVLVTPSLALAENVLAEVQRQAARLSRQVVLKKSVPEILLIVAENLEECFEISNQYAPEHLIVQIDHPNKYNSFIKNAGSVFLGPWSTEALGDYASGPNHVLPTYGYATSYSGLGVESFMKSMTFQEVLPEGLLNLSNCVEHLAALEGLDGHKNAVVLRRELLEKESLRGGTGVGAGESVGGGVA